MRVIGITGGVGSGKSTVLDIFQKNYDAFVLEADKVGHELMNPGGTTYQPIIDMFGTDILCEDGTIDRKVLGAIVFSSTDKLQQLNGITHPAIRTYILDRISAYKSLHPEGLFILEAALLIEEGYDDICDEIWYIYAEQEMRIDRLMSSRGYTREKCIAIFHSQSDDFFYKTHCKYVIDNCGSPEKTKIQIDNLLKN